MQITTPETRHSVFTDKLIYTMAQERPRTAWMDNIKTWTGLPVEESIRMTEDRDKWRKYCTSMVWPTLGLRRAITEWITEVVVTHQLNA